MIPPTVVISLDLELSWGSFDSRFGPELINMARWTHDEGVPRLLEHLTRNQLSASWAIVGAMMRPSLPDVSVLPEVHYAHFPRPWFSYVPPGANETTNPEWFGASLVRMIQAAQPQQEIGFHSFSHVLFGWNGMSQQRAVAEFQACAQIAREYGFSPDSFVYPRNSIGYIDELRKAGFDCYREVDELSWHLPSRKLTKAAAVLADFAGAGPRCVAPQMKHGLVAIPGSLMIRYAGGWRRFIPDASRLRRLRKGLQAVRRNGGVFHVWFHPENLHAERPRLENVVAAFLNELGALVRQGEVRCLTMGRLASEFRRNTSALPA